VVTIPQRHHVEADNYGQNYTKYALKIIMDVRSYLCHNGVEPDFKIFGNIVFDSDIVKGIADCMCLFCA